MTGTDIDATAEATVMVVDDDPAIRRSVARLMRSVGLGVKTFASPAVFLREKLPVGPACVLLDMCMDGMTGLEVQEALGRNQRNVPVVFLSGRGTIPMAARSFKHGAEDFLEKPVRPTELLEAIHRAIDNDRVRSVDRLARDHVRHLYDGLTPREQEVLKLVVSGMLNKQAAAELGISEKTIKVHRARIMEKMGVESFAALVLMAERIGVAPPAASGVAAEAAD